MLELVWGRVYPPLPLPAELLNGQIGQKHDKIHVFRRKCAQVLAFWLAELPPPHQGTNPVLKMAGWSAAGMNPLLQLAVCSARGTNPLLKMAGWSTRGTNPGLAFNSCNLSTLASNPGIHKSNVQQY